MQVYLETSLKAHCWRRATRLPPISSYVKAPGTGLYPSCLARPLEKEQVSFSSLCLRVDGYGLVSPGLWSRSVVRIWVGWWFLCLVVVSRSREALFSPKPPRFTGMGQSGIISSRKQMARWSRLWFLMALLETFTFDTLQVPVAPCLSGPLL